MKIILITHLDLPVAIRQWLGKHYVADAVGALEALRKVQQKLIDAPDGISEEEINKQVTALEHLLTQEGYDDEINTAFKPPPMGVVMNEGNKTSDNNDKDEDNE